MDISKKDPVNDVLNILQVQPASDLSGQVAERRNIKSNLLFSLQVEKQRIT